MALGNPNGGAKKIESPFKGFEGYNVQVYTKDDEKVFKVERTFIMNAPNEDYFDSEEEFNKAQREHSKLLAEYNKHIQKCLDNVTDKDCAYALKQNEKNKNILAEGGDKLAYATFPVNNVTSIDGYVYNMSHKLDKINPKQETEKVYFDVVDFDGKQIYRVNSSFSTSTRNWLDSMLSLEEFTGKLQFKFEVEMDAKKDFKEPRLKDGKPIVAANLMSEFRDGYYRKRVKPLYYHYEKAVDKKGTESMKHLCAESDAKEYHEALQFAITENVNKRIIKFFVGKVNTMLIPKIQKSAKVLFGERGYDVEFMKNERTELFAPSFKKRAEAEASHEISKAEPIGATKSDDLPF